MIDLGDTVPLTFTTASTSVALTIGLPDGTTVTPTPAGPVSGAWSYSYVTTQSGRHTYRWVGTSPNDASGDVFDVADLSAGGIVALNVAKKWLNKSLTATDDDDEIRDLLDATTPVVEDVVGPVVVRQFSEVQQCGHSHRRYNADTYHHGYYQPFYRRPSEFVLGRKQAIALVSVLPVLTGGVTYDVATLDLDLPTGIVRRLDGGSFHGPLRVTYTAGFRVIPGNVRHGTKEIIRHAWETQRGHATARPGLGDEDLVQTPSGFLIPRRAMEWLRPHDRGPVMA